MPEYPLLAIQEVPKKPEARIVVFSYYLLFIKDKKSMKWAVLPAGRKSGNECQTSLALRHFKIEKMSELS